MSSLGTYPTFLDETTETPACRGYDTDLFFPVPGDSAEDAKSICRRCPLFNECRTWALQQPPTQLHGVWGGLSDHDRRKHQRGKARRKPRGAGDHHQVIAEMRSQNPPATYAEIGKAVGCSTEAIRTYWKQAGRQREAVAA